ncbi:MAG: D-aminoacyl-tRNA deacylase [Candidatus Babeliales bacterium]
MKVVIQRVQSACVVVDQKEVSSIKQGLMVLVGIGINDTPDDARYIADKLIKLRIFADDQGKINKSVSDIDGEILLVSQFTLYADTSKGNRPSFIYAMAPDLAEPFFSAFVQTVKERYEKVKTGIFGADMKVHLINDGPTTIILETKK